MFASIQTDIGNCFTLVCLLIGFTVYLSWKTGAGQAAMKTAGKRGLERIFENLFRK